MQPTIRTIAISNKTLLEFAPIAKNQATQWNFVGHWKKKKLNEEKAIPQPKEIYSQNYPNH